MLRESSANSEVEDGGTAADVGVRVGFTGLAREVEEAAVASNGREDSEDSASSFSSQRLADEVW